MEKLKACPFCGSTNVEISPYGGAKAVACMDCFCRSEIFEGENAKEKAIAAWNRRAEPENKIEGECTMDKKSEEIFNKLYDLHDRYDEDPKHMICAEAADHIKKLSEELEKLKATSENKPLALKELPCFEPIYVVPLGSSVGEWSAHWCIYQIDNATAKSDTHKGRMWFLYDTDYGKTWLAYARKPEGSEAS